MYGFTSHSVKTFEPTDVFVWTTGNRNEIVRSVSTPGFFASSFKSCVYNTTEGGCINNNNQTHNYGACTWQHTLTNFSTGCLGGAAFALEERTFKADFHEPCLYPQL
jgi:hypothetical protein